MTGGSASRSAGILSRANELERLNEQGRGLREQLAQAAKALEEADREAAAAGYEMETAQSQLREWEDAILKAEGEAAHCDSVVADLERQSSSQREELEQLKSRSAHIESDTRGARSRIQELEGSAAALKSEAAAGVLGALFVRRKWIPVFHQLYLRFSRDCTVRNRKKATTDR